MGARDEWVVFWVPRCLCVLEGKNVHKTRCVAQSRRRCAPPACLSPIPSTTSIFLWPFPTYPPQHPLPYARFWPSPSLMIGISVDLVLLIPLLPFTYRFFLSFRDSTLESIPSLHFLAILVLSG